MPLNGRSRTSNARFLSGLAALAFTTVVGPRSAAADKKQDCARAYEQSQELRATSKLRAAKDALVTCAQDACPAFVQSDCTQWLVEIHREMPTIIVAATDATGNDVAGVKTTVDGQVLEIEQEGKAVALDPGRHLFRFELEGYPTIERELVVRQGEKDRIITVAFSNSAATTSEPPPPPPTPAAVPEESTPTSNKPGPLRPYAFVAGGVGVAGLVGFTVLGAMGQSQRSDIEDSGCKPNCNVDEVESVRTKLILADVSLGIGIAGIGTAVAFWFLSEPKKSADHASFTPLHFDVKSTRGGGFATVSGRF